MGILILGALCTAAEVFLIYFLVQLFRDARREKQQLRATASRTPSRSHQFARFEMAQPVAKAVWVEGHWQRLDADGASASGEEAEAFPLQVRRSA
jgi:hypothetical protein